MNPDEYRRMFEREERYWWFVARRRLAVRLLRRHLRVARPRTLDLGCGTGVLIAELSRTAPTVGADMSRIALDFARTRSGAPLVQADGARLPFRAGAFDAVIALDVFEHIEDDRGALAECARALVPGGLLVLSVPAFASLWGPHDVALRHFRRYRLGEVRERLRAAGFEPLRLSYSVFFLFPAVVLVRMVEKRLRGPAQARLPRLPGWLDRLLLGLGALEGWLLGWISLPWGSSVVAVARKGAGR